VKVPAGVAGAVVMVADGPPDDPEPPGVELVPGPPEGTVRSSSRSSHSTVLRLGDAGRRFDDALRCIQQVNCDQIVMTCSSGWPPGRCTTSGSRRVCSGGNAPMYCRSMRLQMSFEARYLMW